MPPRIKIVVAIAITVIGVLGVREATALDLPASDPVGVISLVVPDPQPPASDPEVIVPPDALTPDSVPAETPIVDAPPVTVPAPPPTVAQVVPTVPLRTRPAPAPAPAPPASDDDDDLDDLDDDDDEFDDD